MFSVKGFAGGAGVGRYFGSAAAAIVAINTAVTIAATKHAGNNVELPTFVTARLWKEGLTRGTAREPIDKGWQPFPLWIKVPLRYFPLATSSSRHFHCRLPSVMAANKHTQPERFMIPGCLTASFAAGRGDL